MTQSDFPAFSGILAGVAELYGHKLSDMQGALWFSAVSGYTLDQVQAALLKHTKDPEGGKFMPKPADVVRIIDGLPGDRAELAWSRVAAALECHGVGVSVHLQDGIAAQALLDMGGWIKLGRTLTKDMPFVQKEFCRRYAALLAAGASHAPRTLAGTYELDNAGRGFAVQPPVQVSFPVAGGVARLDAAAPAARLEGGHRE